MTSIDQLLGRSFDRQRWLFARLALPLFATLICVACGDVYRPVALPIPGQSPTPAPVGHIRVISTNGAVATNPSLGRGSVSLIDVSGDSVVTSSPAGIGPGVAALGANSRLYVPNAGDDTVFASATTSAPQGTTVDLAPVCDSTGTICPAVAPVFATSTESTRMYVAGRGNGTVSVIDTNLNAVVHTFAVNPNLTQPDTASQPVALAELPDGSKIYSANSGTASVSSINTLDGSINNIITLTAAPVWAAANSDDRHVYVADKGGNVWIIDSSSETASAVPFGAAGSNPNYLFYDKTFNRVYAVDANSAQPALTIFDVTGTSQNPNSKLTRHGPAPVAISAIQGGPCGTSAVVPTSVTVLGDGSRAYVASYQKAAAGGGNIICTQATVVDTASATATKAIPLSVTADNPAQTDCDSARFRVFATSSVGGTNSLFKVYVSQCDAGTVAIIATSAVSTGPSPHAADTLEGWVPSAVSSFPGSQVGISAASQPAQSSTITYTFAPISVTGIAPGMTVYISGLSQLNGAFVIDTVGSSSFTVTSNATAPAAAISVSNQNGTGSVIPAQNPVFLVPGS